MEPSRPAQELGAAVLRAVAPREDRGVTRSEIGGHVARPLVEVLGDDDQERRGVEAIDVGHPTEGEFVALLAEGAWREGAVTTKTRRSRAVSRRLPWHVPARTWIDCRDDRHCLTNSVAGGGISSR
ncbi:MAG: hypothetical protein WBY94_19590, partial [Polyangiaceae bacterium]